METEEKLRGFTVGSVPTVIYIPDFINDAEQTQLFNHIYHAPVSKWKTLKNRRLQNWGGVVHEKGLISQDLPPWLTKITERIHKELGTFSAAPNHVLINEYLPDQGIMPHQDGPAYFPAAAILSLGSPVVMNFTPHMKLSDCKGTTEFEAGAQKSERSGTETLDGPCSFSLLLMPGSLLIFKDLVYSGTLLNFQWSLLLSTELFFFKNDLHGMTNEHSKMRLLDYLHGIEDNAIQPFDGAVNLAEVVKDSGCDELLPFLIGADATRSGDAKILHRTTKRVSLTCRLVLKVRKNLIKI